MGVKLGHKQCEVGIIPRDWKMMPLGEFAQFRNGLNFVKSDKGDIVKVVGVGDFRSDFSVTEDRLDSVQIAGSLGSDDVLKNDDLLFVRSNGNKALIGRCVLIRGFRQPVGFSGFTIRGRVSRTVANPEYVGRYFHSQPARRQIKEAGEGSHISNLSQQVLASLKIPLPTLAEQKAIATALSDADDLIESLEKLIAKKRKIKQGTMQELLTGRKRLPGFSGKWETFRFDQLFTVLRNASHSRSELASDGEVAYVHYGDIHTHPTAFLNPATLQAFLPRTKVRAIQRLMDGDLLMVDASEDTTAIGKAVEIVGLDGREAIAGLHTLALRGSKECLTNGFKGYLQFMPTVRAALVRLATGVSVYGITKSGVKTVEVTIPKRAEQSAIAAILSDMDGEIAALEAKLSKSRLIKQGMMQELLTGRIRLV